MIGRTGKSGCFRAESSLTKPRTPYGRPSQYHKSVSNRDIYDDNPPIEETETEGEKHFKRLLDKQLKKDMTFVQLREQKRNFVKSSTYQAISEHISGEMNLGEFKEIERRKSKSDYLKQCGLNGTEIDLWFASNQEQHVKSSMEPGILKDKLKLIEEKISAKEEEIEKPVQFRDVHYLSRHEMEIESSLKSTSERARFLQKMITIEKNPDVRQANSSEYLKKLERELFDDLNKPTVICERKEEVESIATCEPWSISDKEIQKNRLTVDEIKEIPKFSDYSPGEPSNVLYIKNLPKNTVDWELSTLFKRFHPKSIKILGGRMHGQAFITFSDENFARKALESVNGYKLNKKPMIIQYKKEKIS